MCASPALGLCGASWLCSVRAQLGVGLGCVRSGQARLNCVRVASVSLRLGPAWFALHGLRRSRPGALFAWPAVVLCSDSPGRAALTSRRLGLGLGLAWAWLGLAWHGLGVCPLGVHLAFSSLDAFLRSTGRFMPGLDRICLSSDPHSGSDLPSLDLFCACAPLAHGRACLGLG